MNTKQLQGNTKGSLTNRIKEVLIAIGELLVCFVV